MDTLNNILKRLIPFLKNKKVLLLLFIIIILIIIFSYIITYSSTNIGEVEARTSNLTLKYNNDKSDYYIQEVSTGKNLGDAYINKEEYDGVITLDLSNVQWKNTNESDIDYAGDYFIEDLNSIINNPQNYIVSITVYDNEGNQIESNLIGKDIKLNLDKNILTATVNSNHSSNITLNKNNCNNATYAVFKLNYIVNDVNYTITSNLTGDEFNVVHI